jgi:putative hemolysin
MDPKPSERQPDVADNHSAGAGAISALVRLAGSSAGAVLRRLGVRSTEGPGATEERIKALLEQGAEAGVFDAAEREMVRRIFRLSDRRAGALMTPMKEVVWLDVSDPPERMQQTILASHHSRFPVCEGSIDAVLGVVQVKDLLTLCYEGRPFGLKGLLTMPLLIYEGTTGLKVLEMFKQSGTHIAIVLNEFGSVVGLLTLNDILEAIVGAMPTGEDQAGPKAVQRPDGSWALDGMLTPEEFEDALGPPRLPPGDYHTLAGFVVARLGHIPRAAERFDWGGLTFEVARMDGHRVDQVVVIPRAATP